MIVIKKIVGKLFFAIGLLFLFFPQRIYAQDYYREVLEFDADGNLIMTTRDKIATGNITYKTIGWTIKRYDTGVYDTRNQCAFIPVTTLEASRTDPENSAYKYSYFYCDKDTIFNAIGNVSKEWQTTLYANGGTVFLDAIMTVCDNGIPRGTLVDSAPTCIGDVYFTFDGIVNAATWRDPDSLFSHYGKNLTFPSNPSFLAPEHPPYQILHYEVYGSQVLPLSRYGQDCHGTFTDSFSVPIADFSSHYFQFHYGAMEFTYVDGRKEAITFSGESPPTIQNSLHNITQIVVILYYYRVNPAENLTLDWNYDRFTDTPVISSLGQILANETNPDYNPSIAIPSGSYLDVRTTLDTYAFSIDYQRHYGQITISIPIQTTFDLVWTDEMGTHLETQTLTEIYCVDRSYEFYLLNTWKLYLLNQVNVTQYAFESNTETLFPTTTPTVDIQNKPDVNSHWQSPEIPALITAYGGTLTGNGYKPELPLNTMQTLAESTIGKLTVKNDHFQLDDTIFMSSEPVTEQSTGPVLPTDYSPVTLRKYAVKIPEIRQNQQNTPTIFSSIYQCYGQNVQFTHSYFGNSVSIHTPVFCKSQVSNDKKKNQLLRPDSTKASLILGQTFSIRASFGGKHIDAPGYGLQNYSGFVKELQIKLPFEAYHNDTYLEPNIWHTISPNETLRLPTGVKEGDYEIETRAIALNCTSTDNPEDMWEATANLDPTHTIVNCTIPVQIIGRLYNFSFMVNDHLYSVGTCNEDGISTQASTYIMPYNLEKTVPLTLPFSLTTIGDAPTIGDGIKITPTFFYISETGNNRHPVELYYLTEENVLEKYTPTLFLDYTDCIYSGSPENNVRDTTLALSSVQNWSGTFVLPKPFLVVPKALDLTTLLVKKGSLSPKDSAFLQDGFLLINFNISSTRNGRNRLNYLNTINATNGYCNMWKTEGFSYSRNIDGHTFHFTDGDALLFSLNSKDSKKYKVYGTH